MKVVIKIEVDADKCNFIWSNLLSQIRTAGTRKVLYTREITEDKNNKSK